MELFRLFGTILVDNEAANKSISKTEQVATTSGTGMSKAFKKVGTALVAAFSIDKIMEFSQACIDAYKEQEEADTKLRTIMKQRMNATDGSINSVLKLVSAQEKLGVVSDDVQTAGAQQLSTFLTTSSSLKTLIPSMNNLAVQQKGVNASSSDLVSIGNLMGKVMQGQTSALKRVGVTFDAHQEKLLKTGTEEQRAAVLAQVITDNVGEMNKEIAKTDDGKMQQYKNSINNVQEEIGQKLIPIQTMYYGVLSGLMTLVSTYVLPGINNMISFFGNLYNSVANNGSVVSTLSSIWTTYGIPIFNALINIGNTLYQSWLVIWPAIQNLLLAVFNYMNVAWNNVGYPIFTVLVFVVKNVYAIFMQYWPMISGIIADAFNIIASLYNNVLSPIMKSIGYIVQNYLLPIFTVVFGAIIGVVRTAFGGIGDLWNNSLKPILNGIINFISGVFKGNFQQAFSGLVSIVSGIFNGIKTAMETPLRLAKNVVKGIVDSICGFFNFKFSWPKIPLPHFAVKPKGWEIGDLLKGKIPSLGIDWYANGGIMNNPTLFGMNGNNAMVGGEAGAEAIAPLSKLEEYYAKWSQQGNTEMLAILKSILDRLGEDSLYKVFLRALKDGSLAIILDGREVGRVVKKYA